MPRYFLELAYHGAAYSGFQTQQNANSIQEEVEKALSIICKSGFTLTGSSRTDAGVHARQNFFHFDLPDPELTMLFNDGRKLVYQLNAVLPNDIVVRSVKHVQEEEHARFDALGREYDYYIYQSKDPFLEDRAYYFPYKLDLSLLQSAAVLLPHYSDFTSFSKRNTQVKTFNCQIKYSQWRREGDQFIYTVRANRFLRGMVRALVATMIQVGRGNITLEEFKSIIEAKDCTLARFDVPAHGLFLNKVIYSDIVDNP